MLATPSVRGGGRCVVAQDELVKVRVAEQPGAEELHMVGDIVDLGAGDASTPPRPELADPG